MKTNGAIARCGTFSATAEQMGELVDSDLEGTDDGVIGTLYVLTDVLNRLRENIMVNLELSEFSVRGPDDLNTRDKIAFGKRSYSLNSTSSWNNGSEGGACSSYSSIDDRELLDELGANAKRRLDAFDIVPVKEDVQKDRS